MAFAISEVGRTAAGKQIFRCIETSAADTLLTSSLALGWLGRVLLVTVAYSAAPTQAGATVALDSGAGAGYDSTLNTGTANARYTNYAPANLILPTSDALVVTAPAGGGVITSSIAVYVEGL